MKKRSGPFWRSIRRRRSSGGSSRSRDRLRKLIQGDIRWVRPEGIHLTLKFFGDISAADVANIATVVEKAAEKERPFSLAIGGAGVFPDPHRPRVLWLGMNGDVERLLVFQKGLDQALHRDRFPPRGAALSAASHPGEDQDLERADRPRSGAGKGMRSIRRGGLSPPGSA